MKTLPIKNNVIYKKIKKLQSGANAGVGTTNPASNNTNSGTDWGAILTSVLPILAQNVKNINETKANVDQSNLHSRLQNSAFMDSNQKFADKRAKEAQIENFATAGAIGAGVGIATGNPMLGAAAFSATQNLLPALKQQMYKPKSKYGIEYYEKGSLGEKTGGSGFGPMAGYNLISGRGKRLNEEALKRIQEIEATNNYLNYLDTAQTKGIYAKKGIKTYKFGRYGLQQVKNVPAHKDNVVLDAETGTVVPSAKKGAGGYLIPFGKYAKKKVLIENGEYVLKDEENNVVAVFPEKIGKQIILGKLTVEQALDKIPDVDDAPSVPVKAQSGVQDQNNAQTLLNKMLYEQTPLLFTLLQKNAYQKPLVKNGIKEFINEDGYLKNSKNKNKPFNIIPSNIITTKNMAGTIIASDGVDTKILRPNTGIYKFKNSPVVEFKVAKCGAKMKYGRYKKAQKGMGVQSQFETKENNFGRIDADNYFMQDKFPQEANSVIFPQKLNLPNYKYRKPLIANETTETKETPVYGYSYIPYTNIPYINPFVSNTNDNTNNNTVETVKKVTTTEPLPFQPQSISPSGRKYAGVTAMPSYLLAALQFYNAYKSKPSDRPVYQYDPVVKDLMQTYEKQKLFGNVYDYTNAKNQLLGQRLRAMRELSNTNTSSQSYLGSLANIARGTGEGISNAYNTFITQKQDEGMKNYERIATTAHKDERRTEFADRLARMQKLQEDQNNRYKLMMDALGLGVQYYQRDREEKLNQMAKEKTFTNENLANLAEYYLVYGNDKEKAWAKDYLQNPLKYNAYIAPDVYGMSGTIKSGRQRFGKYSSKK